jgi:hypothetical protein
VTISTATPPIALRWISTGDIDRHAAHCAALDLDRIGGECGFEMTAVERVIMVAQRGNALRRDIRRFELRAE